VDELILFIVILNPFAQILYLYELMTKLNPKEFLIVHFKASLISFIIFAIFALIGENFLMKQVFQVRLASLQIFGGLIMLFIAFKYIVEGPGSNILFQGKISELAPNISLPFMVGPGTIWMAILIGRKNSFSMTLILIAIVLLGNFLFLNLYHQFQYRVGEKFNLIVSKYMAILMRINALFIGAIAIEMLVTGFENIAGKINL